MAKNDKIMIYLAGAMSGTSHEERWGWRNEFEHFLQNNYINYGCNNFDCFFPCAYYDIDESFHKTEREAFEFDMWSLKRSDVVVVNLNRQNSIGTAMEIAVAKDNGVPVIGFKDNEEELHPWIVECCNRVCDSIEEAEEHILCYYLM